ncbi:MAG: shikimate kinase [Bacteroidetes bacterium]|nr:shikimate kinase [Bacteroidota bacterium]
MRVFLIGFMGAGKTTIGRRLASRLNYDFYDTDLYFEEKYHYSIQNFFAHFGEEKFREMERDILHEVISITQNAVISTGGGTPCFYGNMDVMKNSGLTVYLRMKQGALKHRLEHSKRRRPGLDTLNEPELIAYIEKLMSFREKFYESAHISVDGENCKIDDMVVLIENAIDGFTGDPGK